MVVQSVSFEHLATSSLVRIGCRAQPDLGGDDRGSSPTSQPSQHGCWCWPTASPVARFPRIPPATNLLADRSSHKGASRIRG